VSEPGFSGLKDFQDLCQTFQARQIGVGRLDSNHANPLILKIRVRTMGKARISGSQIKSLLKHNPCRYFLTCSEQMGSQTGIWERGFINKGGYRMETLKTETLKQEAIHAISHLPDSADIDEIMYRLYILDKVRKGREAVRKGDTMSVEELRREIVSW
jgi:hypothetical protein